MNKQTIINKFVTLLLIPFMVTFAIYIQIFGEIGPGGGFQAGAILVSAFIAYDLSVKSISEYVDTDILARISAFGVMIYFSTGVYSLLSKKNFLDYSALPFNSPQAAGIIIIEAGVGITVFSVLLLLYLEVKNAD